MKFALFTAPITSYETKRFFKSAQKHGHSLDVIPFQALIFDLSTDGNINLQVGSNTEKYLEECGAEGVSLPKIKKGHDLSQYDAIIARGALRKEKCTS